MPETDIGSAAASDLMTAFTEYSVDNEDTDGAGNSKEFTYQNVNWSTDYGYYLNIPEFKTAVDAKATWTVGAGFEADEDAMLILNVIKGNGKDSFNSILKNMIKCKTISEDAYAEIIRDKNGLLVNIKPLDPSTIVVVQNRQGRIIRYEQWSKNRKNKTRFQPDQIFHLSHERMADEVHGTRIIRSLKTLIDMRNEAMQDWRKVLHRNVRPVRLWYLDTDDTSEIAAFKRKMDTATSETENMYIPKGSVETEIASVAPNQTLNPVTWIQQLNDYFFQAVMVPQIIVGNSKEFTDASGKIVYLAFEQSVKAEQLYIEEQVRDQLDIEIELTFPASLENELISSRDKDSTLQASQPNDTTAELEGGT